MKVNTLKLTDNLYPGRLKNFSGMPDVLYVIGNLELLNCEKTLSVVGARKVTSYGKQVTTDLVSKIAGRNVAIVSGLAIGVDGIAHQSCLDVGGKTIAVMAGGLDHIHPTSHRNLALNILKSGGLLISEYPEGTPAMKQNFIARNRIVSALGDALLVTEASIRSGTIHTANFALEQGKPVLAVPGNINSPNSEGTNNLIKVGASPVTQYNDILLALNMREDDESDTVFGSNEAESKILEALKQGHTEVEAIIRTSGLDVSEFNQALTMLEITGKVRPLGNNNWTLA